jgi:hypothetical protein
LSEAHGAAVQAQQMRKGLIKEPENRKGFSRRRKTAAGGEKSPAPIFPNPSHETITRCFNANSWVQLCQIQTASETENFTSALAGACDVNNVHTATTRDIQKQISLRGGFPRAHSPIVCKFLAHETVAGSAIVG